MIQLGQEVKDTVTGFKGIVTARVEYLNGCVQYNVKPPCVDGKMLAGEYIDGEQLLIIGNGVYGVESKPSDDGGGGPSPDAPSDGYAG